MLKVILQNGKITRNRMGYYFEASNEVIHTDVTTLDEASKAVRNFIENSGIGSGSFTGGDVYDNNNEWIAWVSYNGRVWDASTKYGAERKNAIITK